jgi:hypothetical protein
MKKKHSISMIQGLLLTAMTFFLSCTSDKEIDLKLPEYKSEMFVECYLEAGQPYRLSLYESLSYFDVPPLPNISSAVVTITHNGITDTLKFSPYQDLVTGKVYNYQADTSIKCPLDYTNDFYLKIVDSVGRTLTGKTRFIPKITIDQLEFTYNADSTASAHITFQDQPGVANYFRYQITLDNYKGRPRSDFLFDDAFFGTQNISVGTNYNLDNHGFVIITLYNLNKDYYDFLKSVDDANNSNGNPFAQPSNLKSNVEGGLGIFTTLTYDRIETTVEP